MTNDILNKALSFTLKWEGGYVFEEFENEVEVVCFEINGSPTKRKIKIKKQLLICEQ